MLVVVKGDGGLGQSLQEGLLGARFLKPDLSNGVVAVIELLSVEEFDPLQDLPPLIHGEL